MKKPARIGRPPLSKKERLGKVYGVRLRPDEERDVLRAIQASGQTQADWIRETLLAAARRNK